MSISLFGSIFHFLHQILRQNLRFYFFQTRRPVIFRLRFLQIELLGCRNLGMTGPGRYHVLRKYSVQSSQTGFQQVLKGRFHGFTPTRLRKAVNAFLILLVMIELLYYLYAGRY